MLRLVGALPRETYRPRIYVTATTDALSGRKAMEAEKLYQPDVRRRTLCGGGAQSARGTALRQ